MKVWTCVCIVLIASVLPAAGQESEESQLPQSDQWILKPDLHWMGITLHLGYRGLQLFPATDTILWLGAGGEVDQRRYYTYPDGTPYSGDDPAVDPVEDTNFWHTDGHWRLGIEQGLAWNPELERNWVAFFLFYRGRFERYFRDEEANQLLFRSGRPDRYGIFQNSFLSGFFIDTIAKDEATQNYSGYHGEASVEWGPRWLGNTVFGEADFLRLNMTAKGFVPFFSFEQEGGGRVFNSYGGLFFSTDWITGTAIPINVSHSIGGLDPRPGLGGAVRGVDTGRFASMLKLAGSIEVRSCFPSLIWEKLVPGVITYLDTGVYLEANGERSGVLVSTGLGMFIDFFGMGTLAAYTQYYINGANVDGTKFTPLKLKFGFHF